jgi:aerobic-type carbon monoxide dehydrogenase small subunit (CoxS/CutS family)
MATFRISVNGRERRVDVPGEIPLLDVLRDELELTGAKYGCGEGHCGACVVLVDGESVPSCRLAIGEVGERRIVTAEGLADGAVADAFAQEGALQCGYCTPGLVVAATALLARTPDPSEDEIRNALARNLCRCGVHLRVIRAVRRAARGS